MPEMVTPEELALINEKFAKEPLLSAYCIPMMAADTERVIDDRALRLDASTIAKYAKDAQDGPPLLLSHSHMTSHMGVGRIFQGRDENGKLYLKAYIPPGIDIPNWFGGKFNTDELSKAYDAGLADSVSIGFTFERAECNLCHKDVRSRECPHKPGKFVEVDGQPVECSPVIFAGEKGQLVETSLVWKGALANAKTVKRSQLPGQFGAESSEIVLEKGLVPELAQCRLSMMRPLINNEKELFVQFSHDSVHDAPVTRSKARWDVVEQTLPQSVVDNPILASVIDRMTDEECDAALSAIKAHQDQLAEYAITRATHHFEEVGTLNATLIARSSEVEALKAQIAALTPLSEFGTTYLAGITKLAITAGVKLMGNEFPLDFYTKIFEAAAANGDATVIEKALDAWKAELAVRVTPGRKTVEPDPSGDGKSAVSLNGESPPQTFERLVQDELKANQWGDEHYGDAVRAVSRKHPDLMLALKA